MPAWRHISVTAVLLLVVVQSPVFGQEAPLECEDIVELTPSYQSLSTGSDANFDVWVDLCGYDETTRVLIYVEGANPRLEALNEDQTSFSYFGENPGQDRITVVAFPKAVRSEEALVDWAGDPVEQDVLGIPCQTAENQGVDPGDVILDVGISAIVPPVGESVHAEILLEDGSEELRVETVDAGSVAVSDCGSEMLQAFTDPPNDPSAIQAPGGGGGYSPPPCQDDKYNLGRDKWTTNFHWRLTRGTVPDYLDMGNVEDSLSRASEAIVSLNNNCDMLGQLPIWAFYDGGTNHYSSLTVVNGEDACGSRDGVSVVDFGGFANDKTLASACTYANNQGTRLIESDVQFNSGRNWVTDAGPNCQNRWSMLGVMTHERGHTFGLDHVTETDHGRLTMSRISDGKCQDSEYSLGEGDVRGLKQKYDLGPNGKEEHCVDEGGDHAGSRSLRLPVLSSRPVVEERRSRPAAADRSPTHVQLHMGKTTRGRRGSLMSFEELSGSTAKVTSASFRYLRFPP